MPIQQMLLGVGAGDDPIYLDKVFKQQQTLSPTTILEYFGTLGPSSINCSNLGSNFDA